MAFPLLGLGALLTVGSTLANASAARQQAKARDRSLAAERIRQRGLDQEAAALNVRSQDRFKDAEGQTQERATALGDYFAPKEAASAMPSVANALAGSVMPSASNDVVTREMQKQSGEARRFTDQQGQALGQLRAFGDVLGDTSRLQARDASEVGQIGGFKRGSSNILPLELDAAAQKGGGMRFLGDLLGGVGGVMLNAGITRGPAGLAPTMSPRPVRAPFYGA